MTKQLQQQVQALNNAQFAGRIIAAADNIVQPLPQDVHSGQVFIYQARFTLPTPPAELGPLFYSFSQDKPSDAFISLGSKSDTDQAKQSILNRTSSLNDMFDAVPRLQACNNAVTIVYNQRHDGKAEGNKTLANGKTVYFYSNPGCANDGLLRYAKQIDSY